MQGSIKITQRLRERNERRKEGKKQGRKEERITTTSLNRVKGSRTIKENQHARKKVEGRTRCI